MNDNFHRTEKHGPRDTSIVSSWLNGTETVVAHTPNDLTGTWEYDQIICHFKMYWIMLTSMTLAMARQIFSLHRF